MVQRTKENIRVGEQIGTKPRERKMTEQETWLNRKWRPAMGWMYMVVCIVDFIVFPIAWAIFQSYIGANPVKPHEPLTLQGAGLFHMAMGAVLGIAAWSRGREKMAGVSGSRYYEEPESYDEPERQTRNCRTREYEREYISQKPVTSRKRPPLADEPIL